MKILFKKRYFKIEMYTFTNMVSENFCPVFNSLVSADMDLKNADEKHVVFHGEEKTYKRERKADLWKSTFS